MSTKLVKAVKLAQTQFEANPTTATQQDLEKQRGLLAESKARTKANQTAKVVPGKSKARVRAESALQEAKDARGEAEQAKVDANQAIREHEAGVHTSNEGPARDRVHKLQQCQQKAEDKANELERISTRRQADWDTEARRNSTVPTNSTATNTFAATTNSSSSSALPPTTVPDSAPPLTPTGVPAPTTNSAPTGPAHDDEQYGTPIAIEDLPATPSRHSDAPTGPSIDDDDYGTPIAIEDLPATPSRVLTTPTDPTAENADIKMGSDREGIEGGDLSDDQSIPWSVSPAEKIQSSAKALGKRRRHESQTSFEKSEEENRDDVVEEEGEDDDKEVEEERTQCSIPSDVNLGDVPAENLEKECKRLGLRIQPRFRDKRQRRKELVRLVKEYVLDWEAWVFETNNLSLIVSLQHVRQSIKFLRKECHRRGLPLSDDGVVRSKDKILDTIRAFMGQTIDSPIKNINKSLPAIDLESARNSIVMICSRQSTGPDEDAQVRSRKAREAIEKALKEDQIFSGIAAARFFQSHRTGRLRLALPSIILRKSAIRAKELLEPLQQASAGTVVYLVMVGIEALTFDESSWQEFLNLFQNKKGLAMRIVLAESETQWREREPAWDSKDWAEPVAKRFWTLLDMEELVEGSRSNASIDGIIANFWLQLRACAAGRRDMSKGMVGQNRPVQGRHVL